jgi:hypothetical protein
MPDTNEARCVCCGRAASTTVTIWPSGRCVECIEAGCTYDPRGRWLRGVTCPGRESAHPVPRSRRVAWPEYNR